MKTSHQVIFQDARTAIIEPNSIDLIITSPPYPMIKMWDDIFTSMNPGITITRNGFELMHKELDKVWSSCYQSLRAGSIICINIGDAVRKTDVFQMYPNSARILQSLSELGFEILPQIIWQKTANSPNKFMGSGMLPAGAYVTLEHEHILIARKPGKRNYINRHHSSYFWEERNIWFSDRWTLPGVPQKINNANRPRSGAFPFELAYRLANMYSTKYDTILDPFLGTGTTILASISAARNSIGIEIDNSFWDIIKDQSNNIEKLNQRVYSRLTNHRKFISERKKPFIHRNNHYNFPVVTKQEKDLLFDQIVELEISANIILANHAPLYE